VSIRKSEEIGRRLGLYFVDNSSIMGDMKTQHTYKPMEFAQYFDTHGVHHAVTVLSVLHDGKAVKIHYYTDIELTDVVVKWVLAKSLIPMIGA